MAKYINKAAVVAEIERKKIPFKKDIDNGVYPTYLCAIMDFEDFINTLEVKEVDEEPTSIDISVLLAEIEREYKSLSNATNDFAMGRKAELKNILSFIESIHQQ